MHAERNIVMANLSVRPSVTLEWLINWLIDWLIHSLTHPLIHLLELNIIKNDGGDDDDDDDDGVFTNAVRYRRRSRLTTVWTWWWIWSSTSWRSSSAGSAPAGQATRWCPSWSRDASESRSVNESVTRQCCVRSSARNRLCSLVSVPSVFLHLRMADKMLKSPTNPDGSLEDLPGTRPHVQPKRTHA